MHKRLILLLPALFPALMFPFAAQSVSKIPVKEMLLTASARCDAAIVEDALAQGGDPNAQNNQGSTSLSLAATRAITMKDAPVSGDDPCLQTVQMLLEHGGDPALPARAGDKSPLLHTSLALAAMYQRYAAFALLATAEKKHLNELVGEFGETPLIAAIRYRDPALVRILLQQGASIAQKDVSGETPLDIARGPVDKERMKMLGMVGVTRTEAQGAEIVKLLEDAAK